MLATVLVALWTLSPQSVQTSSSGNPAAPTGPEELRYPVAEMQLEVKGQDPFILHGTLPLPPGTFPPGGLKPLVLQDADGRLIHDTQVEVVSRYADPSQGADVVEVIARVTPEAKTKPNSYFQRFKVFNLERGTQPDPGTPDIYDLLTGTRRVPQRIRDLVLDLDSILVVATDPLGHQYVARPLVGQQGIRVHRYGPYMTTLRTYETLRSDDPTNLPPNPYPHMMGVHTYLSTMAREDVLLLDLRFNNGADGYHPTVVMDDPLGKMYFERIDLYVERSTEWWARQQFLDPSAFNALAEEPSKVVYAGRNYWCFPIVKPLPSGNMHMMPCKSQFLRRMVISPKGKRVRAFSILDRSGQAYCTNRLNVRNERHWSWWNEATARYFPQRYELANLWFVNGLYGGLPDLRQKLAKWYRNCRDAVETGTPFPLPEDNGSLQQLGWARPLGVPDGGATGGLGIQYIDGDRTLASGSTDGYRYLQLRHRLHGDRMPNVVWDQFGDPTGQDKWLIKCPSCNPNVFPAGPTGVPSWTQIVHDMNQGIYDADFCPLPGWDPNLYVNLAGLNPDYETNPDNFYNLNAYFPHNTYHHTRYTRLPIALSWIGNDPVARDDVRAQAEMFRLTYTEYTNQNGSSYAASLANDTQFVKNNPHWGYWTGRGEGWGSTCMNAAWAMADDAWRASMKPWYSRVVSTMALGMPLVQTPGYASITTGLPYDWGTLIGFQSNKFYGVTPPDPRARQTWEEMIVQSAMRGFMESVFVDADPEMAVLTNLRSRSYYSLLSPVSWSENGKHIWETCPVSDSVFVAPHSVYNCDPTIGGGACAGQNNLPGGPYAPKWVDNHYTWPSMADAGEMTGDLLFSRRAYRMLTGSGCTGSCKSQIQQAIENFGDPTWEPDYSEWSNKSIMLGRMQQ